MAPEAMAALPAEWFETLKYATMIVDMTMRHETIAQIRERDAALANILAQLMENFEYNEILTLIQSPKIQGGTL